MGNSVNSLAKPTTQNKSPLSVPIYQHIYSEQFEYSDWYPICLEYIHQGKEAGFTQPMAKRKSKDILKKTNATNAHNNCLFDWLDRDKNDDRRYLLYQPSIEDDKFARKSRNQIVMKPEPVGIYKKLIVQPENDYQQAIITKIREIRKYIFVIQKELRTSRFIAVSVREVEDCLGVFISNLEKLRDYLFVVPKFLQHSKEYEKGISRYLEGMAEYYDSLEWLACTKYGFYNKD